MKKIATVTFDKVEGHTVTGTNIVTSFGSMKDAFVFVSECKLNPYIENVKLDRFDSSK
tara:strand:+ start:97 stop:270 length:174 start_codon:yes stop_codon:yes gene_type:complete